jgi:hypothetical protein
MHQDVYIISTGHIRITIIRGLGGTPGGIARRWCWIIPYQVVCCRHQGHAPLGVFGGIQGDHIRVALQPDSAEARSELGWIPTIDVQRSIEMTVEWEKAVDEGEHARTVTERQVDEYLRLQSQ